MRHGLFHEVDEILSCEQWNVIELLDGTVASHGGNTPFAEKCVGRVQSIHLKAYIADSHCIVYDMIKEKWGFPKTTM